MLCAPRHKLLYTENLTSWFQLSKFHSVRNHLPSIGHLRIYFLFDILVIEVNFNHLFEYSVDITFGNKNKRPQSIQVDNGSLIYIANCLNYY